MLAQKGRILAMISLVLTTVTVVTAFGIAPDTAVEGVQQHLVREVVPISDAAPPQPPQRFIAQERVLRGDTVAALFDRLGVRDTKALDFLRGDVTGRLIFRQLVPGRTLQVET